MYVQYWFGKIPEEGIATHSTFLPENPIDRKARWAIVHRVINSLATLYKGTD